MDSYITCRTHGSLHHWSVLVWESSVKREHPPVQSSCSSAFWFREFQIQIFCKTQWLLCCLLAHAWEQNTLCLIIHYVGYQILILDFKLDRTILYSQTSQLYKLQISCYDCGHKQLSLFLSSFKNINCCQQFRLVHKKRGFGSNKSIIHKHWILYIKTFFRWALAKSYVSGWTSSCFRVCFCNTCRILLKCCKLVLTY